MQVPSPPARASVVSVFGVAAVLFACACSDSNSAGGGGYKTDGGADGSASTLPDPGAAPTSAVGLVSLDYGKRNDGVLKLSLTGMFLNPPVDLTKPEMISALGHYQNIPIDTCADPSGGFSSGTGDQPKALDGGAISLTAPAGGAFSVPAFSPFPDMFIYSKDDFPLDAFVPMGEWKVSVGGPPTVYPQSSGSIWAPGTLELTNPALPAANPLVVPLSAPFELAWQGQGDGHDVIVTITQEASDTQPALTLVCRVTDDGAYTIPSSAFARLHASGGTGNPDSIAVQRQTWYPIGAPAGGLVAALGQFSVGATVDVSFQ